MLRSRFEAAMLAKILPHRRSVRSEFHRALFGSFAPLLRGRRNRRFHLTYASNASPNAPDACNRAVER
jgi:hypothetical protein